jgi:hypothetical protein
MALTRIVISVVVSRRTKIPQNINRYAALAKRDNAALARLGYIAPVKWLYFLIYDLKINKDETL